MSTTGRHVGARRVFHPWIWGQPPLDPPSRYIGPGLILSEPTQDRFKELIGPRHCHNNIQAHREKFWAPES